MPPPTNLRTLDSPELLVSFKEIAFKRELDGITFADSQVFTETICELFFLVSAKVDTLAQCQ